MASSLRGASRIVSQRAIGQRFRQMNAPDPLRTVDGVNHWSDGHVTVYREFPDLSRGTRLAIPALMVT